MLPEIYRVIYNDLPRRKHNAWLISSPDLLFSETKKTLDFTPYTQEERSARIQGYETFAKELKAADIDGLGLGYGSTFFSPIGQSSQDMDGKLIINPADLLKTLSVLRKFQFQGVEYITSELLDQFNQGYVDAFRLRGTVPTSTRQTPFDLELYNYHSLKAFLKDEKYLVRMGLMSQETYAKLQPTITEHSLVVLLDGRRVKYPLYRWQVDKGNCVWLFDVKPAGNIVVDNAEDGVMFGINSVQNTLMESFPYFMEGEEAKELVGDINQMFAKFVFHFIHQRELYDQTDTEVAKQFCELFVRRPRFSRDYYQCMSTRVITMVRAVGHRNKVIDSDEVGLDSATQIGSGFHSQVYASEVKNHTDKRLVTKIFPKTEALSQSEAVQFAAAIQVYQEMVNDYIPMPTHNSIQFERNNDGYKIVLKEDYVGDKNLAQEIQEGLPVDDVKVIFRHMLDIILRIKNDSQENFLTPMIELKPENLVRNNQGELVFVDEFPPRLLEPWTQALWPTYGNQPLEWRQQKAIVHGDLHHILRYMLLTFTILRSDLNPQQFLEEIQAAFSWTHEETDQFMKLVSNSNTSVSQRRKRQAAQRGEEFIKFFGIKL